MTATPATFTAAEQDDPWAALIARQCARLDQHRADVAEFSERFEAFSRKLDAEAARISKEAAEARENACFLAGDTEGFTAAVVASLEVERNMAARQNVRDQREFGA